MTTCALPYILAVLAGLAAEPLTPGTHRRSVTADDRERPYLLHVPPSYDPKVPTPLVVALHPFATNAVTMARISRLDDTADRAGFLVVYPNGTGRGKSQLLLAWNEGGLTDKAVNDVGYVSKVLDDVESVANVDPKRVFATGMSNGAMMCYRLASELSDRIAAIAPVAGTMTFPEIQSKRPVPVLHFHGTKDTYVPFDHPIKTTSRFPAFRPAEETIRAWAKADGCPETPVEVDVPRAKDSDDGLTIKRRTYGPGKDGAEVVLYVVEGGGHTWPGRDLRGEFLGKSALDLNANDLIWQFFQKHPMK